MKALVWPGRFHMQCDNVPDPTIVEPADIIIKTTRTAICGSDLHIYDSYAPMMEKGDILGHEFMGEVVAVGSAVTKHKIGDKVVVPFVISCGHCWACQSDKIPLGTIVNKVLTIRSGLTHVQAYMDELLALIVDGKFDPSFIITHRVSLEEGPDMYKTFKEKKDGCIKVVIDPALTARKAV